MKYLLIFLIAIVPFCSHGKTYVEQHYVRGDVYVLNNQELRLRETDANGANYVALKAPASVASNVVFSLPGADGASNTSVQTDGSGNLSFSNTFASPTFTTGALLDDEAYLEFQEAAGNGDNYIRLKAAATLGADYTLTLPSDDGDSGDFLKTDGSGVTSWSPISSLATPTVQRFTSGSGTYTTAPGATWLRVRIIGGGGGGGGSGTTSGTSATAGGNSTFGTRTAGGGAIGGWLSHGNGGNDSGSGYTQVISSGGGNGCNGNINPSTANGTQLAGGAGGGSALGGAGHAGSPGGGGGTGRTNTGGGGGGGGNDNTSAERSGGGGGAGAYVEFHIISPGASYSYGVGAAGSGGGAGTSGRVGGAGAAGIVIVEEFY